MKLSRCLPAAMLAVAAFALCGSVSAQTFPSKSIRIVVGFAPGGAVDIIGRILAERLAANIRHPVIIDNRAGASGIIGADLVAKAAADGYTLFFTPSPHVISPVVYANVPFDPIADFEPVSLVANLSYFVIANPRLPANNLRELISLAKASPGKLTYGTAGYGTVNHLAMELLKQVAGIDMRTVNYKGGGPAQNDVIAGHIDLMVASAAQAAPFIIGGKVKALAITADSRLAEMPNIPTATESGLLGHAAVRTAQRGPITPR